MDSGLQEPAGGHAGCSTSGHDQVVHHSDPDQLQRRDQLVRDGPIGLAGIGHAKDVAFGDGAAALVVVAVAATLMTTSAFPVEHSHTPRL